MDYYIGVDLGGTNTKVGILDIYGNIYKNSIIKTLSLEGAKSTLTRIWEESKKMLSELKIDVSKVKGIGIGIPAPVIKQAIIPYFSNFTWEQNINLKELMEKISGIETKLDNDVNIIALGEAKYGAGKNCSSSMTIALGTGIGGGICIDGKILSGFNGSGGELGHMKVVPNGKLCGCGQKGCFEAYASATGLVREALSRLMVNKNNLLYKSINGDLNKLEAKNIFDAVKNEDKFSMELVEYEAEFLSIGIANILNVINPEMIILSGGLALAGDTLLNPVREKIKKYTFPPALKGIKIVQGVLGNEAGLKGSVGLFVL